MADKKEKKSHFRDKLLAYVRTTSGEELGNLNNRMKSYWMTKYYVCEVLSRLQPELVPEDPDELAECFTDCTGDLGVDFISRVDKRVLIIQSKYRGTSSKVEPPRTLSRSAMYSTP